MTIGFIGFSKIITQNKLSLSFGILIYKSVTANKMFSINLNINKDSVFNFEMFSTEEGLTGCISFAIIIVIIAAMIGAYIHKKLT